jgi:hypothetical protein
MAGNLKTLRRRWRKWVDTKAHPWERVKGWAKVKGKPRKTLKRWRVVQRWAKQKKDQQTDAAKKAIWRARYRVARKRARAKLEWLQEHAGPEPGSGGAGMSIPSRRWNPQRRYIVNWMVPWIDKIDAAGWNGVVVSGYRTPAYSQQLCYAMCGAPACPGRCAGVNSNHNKAAEYPNGAVDVTDYLTFKAVASRVGSPLRNALPSTDPVHFSVSGV